MTSSYEVHFGIGKIQQLEVTAAGFPTLQTASTLRCHAQEAIINRFRIQTAGVVAAVLIGPVQTTSAHPTLMDSTVNTKSALTQAVGKRLIALTALARHPLMAAAVSRRNPTAKQHARHRPILRQAPTPRQVQTHRRRRNQGLPHRQPHRSL